jgi:hypothetical protein
MMIVDPYRFKGSSPATISYEGTVTSGASGTSQSTSSVPIGTADALRTVIQTLSWNGGGSVALTAATIGGIAADIVQFSAPIGGGSFGYVAIISADIPTGTTATTAVTFGGAASAMVVHSFKAVGLGSKTATDTENATAFGNTSQTVSPDVLAGGVIVAAVYGNGGGAFTTTGATEAYDANLGAFLQISGGYYTTPSAEIAHAITFASSPYNGPVVAAAFR